MILNISKNILNISNILSILISALMTSLLDRNAKIN